MNASGYRYGFNGKENDSETEWQDYGMRLYDTRLGRFVSADPLIVQEQKYPELSPYQFASNTPIVAIDLDGLETAWNPSTGSNAMYYMAEGFRVYFDVIANSFTFKMENNLFLSYKVDGTIDNATYTDRTKITNTTTVSYTGSDIFKPTAYPSNPTAADIPSIKGGLSNTTKVTNEKTIKTSNVTTTVTLNSNAEMVRNTTFSATVPTNAGVPLTLSSSYSQSSTGTTTYTNKASVGPSIMTGYAKTTTTTTTTTPNIGRFLSVDPLTNEYPWYTPYQFAGNTPIACVDIDGLEPVGAGLYPGQMMGFHIYDTNRDGKVSDSEKKMGKQFSVGFTVTVIGVATAGAAYQLAPMLAVATYTVTADQAMMGVMFQISWWPYN